MRQGDGYICLSRDSRTVPLSRPSLFALLLVLNYFVRYTVKQELKKEGKQKKYIREKNNVEKVRYEGNMAPRYGAVYETRDSFLYCIPIIL